MQRGPGRITKGHQALYISIPREVHTWIADMAETYQLPITVIVREMLKNLYSGEENEPCTDHNSSSGNSSAGEFHWSHSRPWHP